MSRFLLLSVVLCAALSGAFAAGWFVRGVAVGVTVTATRPLTAPAEPPGTVRTQARDPRPAAFAAALAAGDHDRALAIYEALADAGREPELVAELRARMFAPLRARDAGAPLADAVAFLEAFTWLYGRDAGALTALAQGQERLGRLREALDSWWRLADAAGGGPVAERALRRARVLVDGLADGARTRGDRGALADTYREALRRDPGAHRFRVLLAEVLDGDGDWAGALEVLDGIPAGVLDDARLDRLRARLAEAVKLQRDYPQGLPLRAFGDHFVVTVAADDGSALELLLDTGATVSVLRPQALGRVPGARPAGRTIRLGTAGGVVTAPLYRIEALSLGPMRMEDVRVAVLSLDGLEAVDGLLGMDELSRFDYRIDPALGRLRLAHRRDTAGGTSPVRRSVQAPLGPETLARP